MAWQLSRRGDQYRIWYDGQPITDWWTSRNEVLSVWYDEALLDFKESVIKKYLQFPHEWVDHESRKRIKDEAAHEQYQKWMSELTEKLGDEIGYRRLVNEMFKKIVEELKEND
jgi:hypothetical protein